MVKKPLCPFCQVDMLDKGDQWWECPECGVKNYIEEPKKKDVYRTIWNLPSAAKMKGGSKKSKRSGKKKAVHLPWYRYYGQ
jgi:tRNA(Ile2) C34 agmatinyltransferase TiaS